MVNGLPEASFKDIPEIFEVELGESLTARTESLSSFRELGPPDLCHVVKSTGRTGQRDFGSYHYISGVDASSSASLAAYINSLTYAIEDNSAWFSKTPQWKVKNGCYCCFNAFSRVDIRVDVKIPGGVNAYVIDLRGERHEATPEIWQETYVSAILRAILYSDDPTYFLDAYRKLDPIASREGELRFLQAAEALFPKGWQVGSDPEIQVATVVSNHLTAGIMKYFGDSGRYQPAANLFEKLSVREPEVASLLARSYLGMNEEVKAVQIMSAAIKQMPQSYTLLHVQCDFLRSKGKHEWALRLARQAVNCAPSEFVTWEKLAEIYIDLQQYDSALLTLNSCPMFTFNGRDSHRALPALKIHLPFHRPIGDILPERHKTEDDEAEPALQRLPAPGLRGTWARAYGILTRLVSQIGWDELLKTRSQVFVMEEEYRMQKAQGDIQQALRSAKQTPVPGRESDVGTAVIHEDGTVIRPSIDDNASTKAVMSPPSPVLTATENEDVNGNELDHPSTIPMIRISTESQRVKDDDQSEATKVDEQPPTMSQDKGKGKATEEEEEEGQEILTNGHGQANGVEKPEQAAGEGEQAINEASPAPTQESFSFSTKRLCERWLDNLFMVLYEDLRVWTIFRAEVAHFKTQHVAYRKTGLEWEILGDLGIRLHHKEEAKEAFQRCLDSTRYSVKPWAKLMEMYADEGDIQRTVQTAIRVAAYQYADYTEMSYPTQIARAFFTLGQIHGHAKISFTLLSMGLPDPILKIMDSYLQYGKNFRVEGYDF
ncbi:Chs5p-Arf1p-binding proteins-domain-containing protein [Gymnopilus junonius]|uniref:Chs5p-Arf1p-binding proteins-domain-containing protein n=1 Tax=Gymnopilus junonius TaxID=109634 RepID=A0A9P5TS10_GYMJU|nr:Chs5p-Arf1p-binding proteins-domain-containing protein [Gymnopilus junonius]